MSSKIYVGNLPYSVTDASLKSNFAEFGGVSSAKVMMDRDTGQSKGFGFVEMASAVHAQAAISGLHGMSVMVAPSLSTRPGRARIVALPVPTIPRATARQIARTSAMARVATAAAATEACDSS